MNASNLKLIVFDQTLHNVRYLPTHLLTIEKSINRLVIQQ